MVYVIKEENNKCENGVCDRSTYGEGEEETI